MRSKFNRRELLSGVAAGAAATLSGDRLAARTVAGEIPWAPGDANKPDIAMGQDYQYLTADEAKFIEAAVARLIPADDLGPGAKDAGAALFIDRQLLGAYGAATNWYMQGPWADGEETQGYQSRMTPAQLYRAAIKTVDEHCRKTFGGKAFSALAVEQQDRVLTSLEKDEIKFNPIKGKAFFNLLLQNTIEGFFSDPIYGGNRDKAGWKLIGFPGAIAVHRDNVEKYRGKKYTADILGIADLS